MKMDREKYGWADALLDVVKPNLTDILAGLGVIGLGSLAYQLDKKLRKEYEKRNAQEPVEAKVVKPSDDKKVVSMKGDSIPVKDVKIESDEMSLLEDLSNWIVDNPVFGGSDVFRGEVEEIGSLEESTIVRFRDRSFEIIVSYTDTYDPDDNNSPIPRLREIIRDVKDDLLNESKYLTKRFTYVSSDLKSTTLDELKNAKCKNSILIRVYEEKPGDQLKLVKRLLEEIHEDDGLDFDFMPLVLVSSEVEINF